MNDMWIGPWAIFPQYVDGAFYEIPIPLLVTNYFSPYVELLPHTYPFDESSCSQSVLPSTFYVTLLA